MVWGIVTIEEGRNVNYNGVIEVFNKVLNYFDIIAGVTIWEWKDLYLTA
jgi:hypothetical protein